jgi:N-acetylglucosaminyl-diphospho-decaprenol L-rhamnosyltransferase
MPNHGSSMNTTATEPVEIVVAIVNYCTPDVSIDCLRSLEPETRRHAGMRVLVADNASPDRSGDAIAEAIEQNGWSAWARLLQLPRNGGFAYGNNAVLREFQTVATAPRYFWLLNSDTVVLPGATQALIDVLVGDPTIGIAGSCLEDPDGTQQHSAFRFHTIASELETSACLGPITRMLGKWAVAPARERKTARYDWVSGASMMIRSEVVRDIGLMDESYFLYYEETDYCRKAAAAGWTCVFVAESRIVHLVGRSTGVTDRTQQARRRSAYWFDSRRRYFVTHHGRLYAIAADGALALGTIIRRCIAAIRQRPSGTPQRFLLDLIDHSALWRMPAPRRERP